MKKIILTAIVAVVSIAANAQIWAGGSLGFSNNSPKEGDNSTTLTFAPEIGYTLNDKIDLGVALDYTSYKQGDASTSSFSIEPYVRYTFMKAGKLSLFAEGVIGFGSVDNGDSDADDDDDDYPTTNVASAPDFKIGVRPGLKYDLTDKFSFVSKLGWVGFSSYENSSAFDIKASTAVSLGFVYNF